MAPPPGAADVDVSQLHISLAEEKDPKSLNFFQKVPVQVLAETGKVPECFLRESLPSATDAPATELPVVNMAAYLDVGNEVGKAQVRARIKQACEEWGFFHVVNHGASSSVLAQGMEAATQFFQLPVEEKLKCAMNVGARNWAGYGRLLQHGAVGLEWNDTFYHHDPLFHGPAEGHEWPDKPEGYKDKIQGWRAEICKVASTLHQIIAQNLSLPDTSCLEKLYTMAAVKTNYYPACTRPSDVIGLSSHADASSITILQQTDRAGLQIMHNEQWITIHPLAGALVVNIGDVLEIMSNGRYKSLLHRVLVNSEEARMSVVLSFRPPLDAYIAPFPEAVDQEHPLRYRTVKFQDYIQMRGGKLMNGKDYVNEQLLLPIHNNSEEREEREEQE